MSYTQMCEYSPYTHTRDEYTAALRMYWFLLSNGNVPRFEFVCVCAYAAALHLQFKFQLKQSFFWGFRFRICAFIEI